MTVRPAGRHWLLVWGTVFVCSWGGNQFSPMLLLYEQREHFSPVFVTSLLGVYVLGLAPALLVAGSLSDRHGRRPVMVVGVVAALLGSGMLALGGLNGAFLVAGRLLSGVTVGVAMAVGTSWVKELSQSPWDQGADRSAGARRAALAFTLGSGLGALIAGLLAQWGPYPEVLPFLIHLAVTAPFLVIVARAPETNLLGGVSGPWWRQLRVPSAGHRRFVRVVAVAAPWIFLSAAVGYGYLPTRLAAATGENGLLFATAATVVALGVSSLVQPLAKRLHSPRSARGLVTAVFVMAAGLALVTGAVAVQSVWLGIVANAVIGAGMGIALVSALLEVQAIATDRDLAGLTGVFYAVAYVGFLAPAGIAALAGAVPVTTILLVVTALAVVAGAVVLASSRRYLQRPPA
ncbi:MFS transporter [Herbiconiux moechotypicola]|uniref:MFS transporter n=1 Tax=Herbiconiux moechotypicola TaxID=637393 RepID=A0ABN3E243_9MICO|nr:MFS transporter [Herbiconiux moechotypicola]MCS5731394.1 MFS transporter [Herbiconiux moechotypicola]